MASEPFVNKMRRGNVHVNASRKTFKNSYREDPGGEAAPKILPRPGGRGCAKNPADRNSPCPPASRFIS